MNWKWFVIVPATLAWFAACVWYATAPNGCACAMSSAKAVAAPQAIQLGPTTTIVEPEAAATSSAALGVASPSVSPESVAMPTLTVRFPKNTGAFVPDAETAQWSADAKQLLSADATASLIISGYTDADGDERTNIALSLARAELVRNGLIELGLPAERITAVGNGAIDPVSDNRTSRGKALNRRVEIAAVRNATTITN